MKNNDANGAFGNQLRGKQDINQRRIELLEQERDQLKKERDQLKKEKEWLHQRLSYLLVAVNALGRHSKLEPHEAKKVIDDYILSEEVKIQEQMEVAKQKFKDDIASGKMPEGFKVVDNIEKAAEEPPKP